MFVRVILCLFFLAVGLASPAEKKPGMVNNAAEDLTGGDLKLRSLRQSFPKMTFKRFSRSMITPNDNGVTRVVMFVPQGWKVVSGGVDVEDDVLLFQSHPIFPIGDVETPNGWFASGVVPTTSSQARVYAYAVALWDPNDDYSVITNSTLSEITPNPQGEAQVPANHTLVGGGAVVLGGGDPKNFLISSYPKDQKTWAASSKANVSDGKNAIAVYAIGLRYRHGKLPPINLKSTSVGPASKPSGSVEASCGYVVIGGGARVSTGGVGKSFLTTLEPAVNGRYFNATAKEHSEVDKQTLTISIFEVKGGTYQA